MASHRYVLYTHTNKPKAELFHESRMAGAPGKIYIYIFIGDPYKYIFERSLVG
jgi:hypothetical protein